MPILAYWSSLAAAAQLGAVALVLLGSLSYQFILGELPCPLCVLQRIAFLLACVGPIGIIQRQTEGMERSAADARGFALTIGAALLGLAVSTRQVLLHIVPPDAGYGPPVMGMHLYSWAVFVFICLIFGSAVGLFGLGNHARPLPPKVGRYLGGMVLAIALVIAVATFAMEGFNRLLPDDPQRYELFH